MGAVEKMANYFGITKSAIVDDVQPTPATPIPPGFIPMPPMRKVPLVGSIACGTPILAQQNIDGSVAAFVDINLYVRKDGEWSKPIFGTGGSKLISVEKKYSKGSSAPETSLYLSDEAYKMAYTDALSVACKALGIAADVYYEKDKSKYIIADEKRAEEEKSETTATAFSPAKKTLQPGKPGWKETIAWLSDLRKDPATVKANYNITEENFEALCKAAGRAS